MNDGAIRSLILKSEARILNEVGQLIDEKIHSVHNESMQFKDDVLSQYAPLQEDHSVLAHQVAEIWDTLEILKRA